MKNDERNLWIVVIIMVTIVLNQNGIFQGAIFAAGTGSESTQYLIDRCEAGKNIYDCQTFFCLDNTAQACLTAYGDSCTDSLVYSCDNGYPGQYTTQQSISDEEPEDETQPVEVNETNTTINQPTSLIYQQMQAKLNSSAKTITSGKIYSPLPSQSKKETTVSPMILLLVGLVCFFIFKRYKRGK